MKYFWIFLLICGVCFMASAETINEKYSYKAFPYHGVSFKNEPVEDFNNSIIVGSCFYQECVEGDIKVVKDIFPDGMTEVTFDKCNTDNVYIDETKNTIKGGCHRKIQVQNDWEDWILDKVTLNPKEPMNKEERIKAGISYRPEDLPSKKFTREERRAFENSINISN